MTPVEILERTLERYQKRGVYYTRFKQHPDEPSTVALCAIGTVQHVAGAEKVSVVIPSDRPDVVAALNAMDEAAGPVPVESFIPPRPVPGGIAEYRMRENKSDLKDAETVVEEAIKILQESEELVTA